MLELMQRQLKFERGSVCSDRGGGSNDTTIERTTIDNSINPQSSCEQAIEESCSLNVRNILFGNSIAPYNTILR